MNKKIIRNSSLIVIIVIMLIAAALFFQGNIFTPYVSFKQCKEQAGTYVQILGEINKQHSFIPVQHGYKIRLVEKNVTIDVVYTGALPQNFKHAHQAVAIGTYDKSKNQFMAKRLLLKCPSKYNRKTP